MLKAIDHVGILVEDIDEAMGFLTSLGFTLYKTADAPNRRRKAAFFDCGTTGGIELIQDLDPKAREDALGGRKARVEHIAIEVDDLLKTLKVLEALGITPDDHGVVKGPFKSRERTTAWTEPAASDGVIYQFVSYSDP